MMRRIAQIPIVIVWIALAAYCGVWALRTLAADQLVAAIPMGDPAASRQYLAAARWRPDEADLWREAAATATSNPVAAERWVRRALAVEPGDWRAWQLLGLLQLQQNDMAASQHSLEEAARWSHSFDAHYALANLAFLLGERASFWRQMVLALAVAPGDQVAGALDRAMRLSGRSPDAVAAVLPHGRPSATLAAADFFLHHHDLEAATHAWALTRCGAVAVHTPCIFTLQRLMDAWVAEAFRQHGSAARQDVETAMRLWNGGIQAGLLHQPRQRRGDFADGDLRWNWFGPSFSWTRDTSSADIEADSEPDQSQRRSLQMQFSGEEPDYLPLTHHYLPVAAGGHYRLSFRTRQLGAAAIHGLAVSVTAAGELHPLATINPGFSPDWASYQLTFQVPADVWLVNMEINYTRALGEMPLQATVGFDTFRLQAEGGGDVE